MKAKWKEGRVYSGLWLHVQSQLDSKFWMKPDRLFPADPAARPKYLARATGDAGDAFLLRILLVSPNSLVPGLLEEAHLSSGTPWPRPF